MTMTFAELLGWLLWAGIFVYILGVLLIILLDNRTPQSTFAWLFLMLTFPVVGLLIYLFTGRSQKAFSDVNKLAKIEIGGKLRENLRTLDTSQKTYVQKIAEENPASYRHQLLNLVQRNSASIITAYNRVKILQDATEKYTYLMEDICSAQHSIHLLYFIWTEDDFTRQVKDALIERAKAGVKVRALVDQANFVVSKAYQQELRDAGVQIYPYLAFKNLKSLHTANYRGHRKIIIVDGKIGFVGGMNLDKEQLPGNHPLGDWRDIHLRLEGEAAQGLQASFAISWFNTTGEKLVEAAYYPPVDPHTTPFTPVQLTNGGPDSQWKAMQQLYFFLIMSAKEKCYIQSPFFIPDESLLEAIKASALSGVDVRIMCTPRGGSYQMPYRAAYTYFADVARAGAKIYLYNRGYFHPKTINIDGQVCAVGTANFDIRSFFLNYETMAVIYDENVAQELEAGFMNDLKNCDEWSLEEYQQAPLMRRLLDSVNRLASPLL
ncbi:MAG: cardiolipin synthase [Chloroflexota bacterium]